MFSLINGKPQFYIGKINDIGYTTKKEKEELIKQFDNTEVVEEIIDIPRDYKEKAMQLGELQLTYSKSEFLQYMNGEKEIPGLSYKELKQENEALRKSSQMSLRTIMELDQKVISLEKKLSEITK